ncbi:hypothetical protein [Streptomyces sp. 8N706]|uniref:hypothetical protein n=1 Tax=Streptomyces sp. 8N706 TaxID=3457416 RepID=UPI003FD2E5A6
MGGPPQPARRAAGLLSALLAGDRELGVPGAADRLTDGQLHEVPWIHRDHVHAPMGETAWRHIRAALNRRGHREAHEAALADTADQVLRRSRPPAPQPAAAATPSQTAGSLEGTLPAQHPAQDAEGSLDAVEASAHDDDDSQAGDEDSPPPAGFALYDALEEAEHW